MREEKQKVRLEIQCLAALLPAGSMGAGGSGHGILRPDLHRKHLQRYFTQIIRY